MIGSKIVGCYINKIDHSGGHEAVSRAAPMRRDARVTLLQPEQTGWVARERHSAASFVLSATSLKAELGPEDTG